MARRGRQRMPGGGTATRIANPGCGTGRRPRRRRARRPSRLALLSPTPHRGGQLPQGPAQMTCDRTDPPGPDANRASPRPMYGTPPNPGQVRVAALTPRPATVSLLAQLRASGGRLAASKKHQSLHRHRSTAMPAARKTTTTEPSATTLHPTPRFTAQPPPRDRRSHRSHSRPHSGRVWQQVHGALQGRTALWQGQRRADGPHQDGRRLLERGLEVRWAQQGLRVVIR
jgi:hypothetical protein